MECYSHSDSPYRQMMADDNLFEKLKQCDLSAAQDIYHVDTHNRHISDMFMNEVYCDHHLIVQNESIPVNKSILASRCQYFRAMFFSNFSESSKTSTVLPNIKKEPFKYILFYIYNGKLIIEGLDIKITLKILKMAQFFGFEQLVERIIYCLKATLSMQNIWIIYKVSRKYFFQDLIRACIVFIDTNADQIITDKAFDAIDERVLIETLSRDSFYVEEVLIFKAVCNWIKNHETDDAILKEIFSCVRISSIKKKELQNLVKEVDCNVNPKMLEKLKTNSKPRGCLVLNQNVASKQFNVNVLKGRKRSKMINESNRWYSRRTNCTSHSIETSGETQILITLSKQFILNHIRMCLFDSQIYAYSYVIEVSVDKKKWTNVVDYSKYLCHSWQHLFFKPLSVKFIRIIGNRCLLLNNGTKHLELNVLYFECMYCTIDVAVLNTLVVAKQNVWKQTVDVFQYCERKYLDVTPIYPKTLLKSGQMVDNLRIPYERGCVCWCNGTDCIYFQLSQPFMITSLGFSLTLIRNSHSNLFTYSIEVSCDFQTWFRISDQKTIQIKDNTQEILRFQAIPIVFVRLVSSNFMTVSVKSFECPVINDNLAILSAYTPFV